MKGLIHIKKYSKNKKKISKFSDKLNKYDIIEIIISIVLFTLVFIKLPFYVERGEGINNIKKIIDTSIDYKMEGSYNITYVSEFQTNIYTYLLALLNPNWDIYSEKELYGSVPEEEDRAYSLASLNYSRSISKMVAFSKSGVDFLVSYVQPKILYKSPGFDNDLEIGDTIKSINGIGIRDMDDISDIISKFKNNDKIELMVENNNKFYKRYAVIKNDNNRNMIGILSFKDYNIISDIDLNVNYASNTYGSSGSFMVSLMIYDILNEHDLTNGLKISGTGVMVIDGTIDPIGGVKYKLKGAVNKKADIFFVPSGDNYDEAIKEKEKHNYNIEIVPVSTIDDAINYLTNYRLN